MVWPPVVHQDVEDEVGFLRDVGDMRYNVTAVPWSVPGVDFIALTTTTYTANRIYYEPFVVSAAVQIDALGLEVTTAAAASSIRLGIYRSNLDAQPTSLVVEAPTIADAATVGVKTLVLTTPLTLTPGRYVKAYLSNGAPTLRSFRAGTRQTGLAAALGTNPFLASAYASFTFGPLPATGAPATVVGASNLPINHTSFMRVTA